MIRHWLAIAFDPACLVFGVLISVGDATLLVHYFADGDYAAACVWTVALGVALASTVRLVRSWRRARREERRSAMGNFSRN